LSQVSQFIKKTFRKLQVHSWDCSTNDVRRSRPALVPRLTSGTDGVDIVSGPRMIDVTAPGKPLRAQFFGLGGGELGGKTVDEVIAAVGPPT
jgi:hypothetical protein